MNNLLEHVSMRHLMAISLGFVLLGVLWIAVVLMAAVDQIWLVPGFFLIISGVTKAIAVRVWVRVAKLGTDEHEPIKAL